MIRRILSHMRPSSAGGLAGLPWHYRVAAGLFVAGAFTLVLQCGGPPPAGVEVGGPCEPFKPKCEGIKRVSCEDKKTVKIDCAALGKEKNQQWFCSLNGKGEAVCAPPCDKWNTHGYCKDSTHMWVCDGKSTTVVDCALTKPEKCGYMSEGFASFKAGNATYYDMTDQSWILQGVTSCSKACPDDLDFRGKCEGGHAIRCLGQIFSDIDCTKVTPGMQCMQADGGVALCAKECPEGTEPYGKCDDNGDVDRCIGDAGDKRLCKQAGLECKEIDRFGFDCQGCKDVPNEGKCNPKTAYVEYCDMQGRYQIEACKARGGTCDWDEDLCRYACKDAKPDWKCASMKMEEGEKRCYQDPTTQFWSILTCKEGFISQEECPASGTGEVVCVEGAKPTDPCAAPAESGGASDAGADAGDAGATDAGAKDAGDAGDAAAPAFRDAKVPACIPKWKTVKKDWIVESPDGGPEGGPIVTASGYECAAALCTDRQVLLLGQYVYHTDGTPGVTGPGTDDVTAFSDAGLGPIPSWIDCLSFGGKCKLAEDMKESAYCECKEIPKWLDRCVKGMKPVCKDGKIAYEKCKCVKPAD